MVYAKKLAVYFVIVFSKSGSGREAGLYVRNTGYWRLDREVPLQIRIVYLSEITSLPYLWIFEYLLC